MMGRLPAALCLLLVIAGAFGQEDFDLGDAVEVKPTEKPQPAQPGGGGTVTEKNPTVKPQPGTGGGSDGGFNLDDAVGDDPPTQKPRQDKPVQGGGSQGGSFGDDDLADAAGGLPPRDPSGGDARLHGRAMQPSSGGEGGEVQGEEKQSVIAGVLGALGVALVGAASSWFAYQKKKLCFKGQADDPENVNMDAHKGDQHDPQAQNSLLAK